MYFGHAASTTPRQHNQRQPPPPPSSTDAKDSGFLPMYAMHEAESPSPSPASQHGRTSSLSMDDPTVQKSLFEMFNKRGYNLISPSNSMVNGNSSFSSTASSSMSSVIGFREPVHGQTPIHIAIRRGDLQVVEALVKSGDTDILQMRDDHGNTPLHFAVGISSRRMSLSISIQMVKLLLAAGASVHAVNHKGRTPIMVHMLTIRKDDPAILTMLLKEGSNVNAAVDRVPLLHLAVASSLPIVTAVLITHGANLHAVNELGLYLREVAPLNMLVTMLAHLTVTPPFIPLESHSQCMDCRRYLKPSKRSGMFRWLFRSKSEATHCFLCGWIYCSACTGVQPLREALPPSFSRSETEELEDKQSRSGKNATGSTFKLSRPGRAPELRKDVSIRCCRICATLLKERLVKGARASLYQFQQASASNLPR